MITPRLASLPLAIFSMATTEWFAANSLDFVVARLKTAGDGFFAAFDGPARAVRCACAVSQGMQSWQFEVRAGLHTGECEIRYGWDRGPYRRSHRGAGGA